MPQRKRKTKRNENQRNHNELQTITEMDEFDIFNPMHAMNMQMRSMNRLMNSLMPDPFNMLTPFDGGFQQNALMDYNNGRQAGGGGMALGHQMGGMGMNMFGFPAMPNINRLLNADIGSPNGASYCSSSVITMSSGPDGRPQVYQATTSTKTGPGGVRETRKTVQDSTRGIKKMAIGHHIGERAHIIEKEQDLNSGQLEERQEFVNLDEEQAEEFDREFTTRAQRGGGGANAYRRGITHHPLQQGQQMLTIEPIDDDDDDDDDVIEETAEQQRNRRRQLPALPAPPTAAAASTQQQQQQQTQQPHNSVHPHPYNASAARRNYRSKHTKQHQQSHGTTSPTNTTTTTTNDVNGKSSTSPKHHKK